MQGIISIQFASRHFHNAPCNGNHGSKLTWKMLFSWFCHLRFAHNSNDHESNEQTCFVQVPLGRAMTHWHDTLFDFWRPLLESSHGCQTHELVSQHKRLLLDSSCLVQNKPRNSQLPLGLRMHVTFLRTNVLHMRPSAQSVSEGFLRRPLLYMDAVPSTPGCLDVWPATRASSRYPATLASAFEP